MHRISPGRTAVISRSSRLTVSPANHSGSINAGYHRSDLAVVLLIMVKRVGNGHVGPDATTIHTVSTVFKAVWDKAVNCYSLHEIAQNETSCYGPFFPGRRYFGNPV